jgi:hypothetical protein
MDPLDRLGTPLSGLSDLGFFDDDALPEQNEIFNEPLAPPPVSAVSRYESYDHKDIAIFEIRLWAETICMR